MLLNASETRASWLLLRSKPRQEALALESLSSRGFETYCPRVLEKQSHRYAPSNPVPLFPGYLFCRAVLTEAFRAAGFAHGVGGFVKFGERFAALDDDDVERLRQGEGERGFLVARELRVAPKKGERVRVVTGAFKGYEGVVMDYCSGKERVRLLLMLVTGSLRVEVPAEEVRVA